MDLAPKVLGPTDNNIKVSEVEGTIKKVVEELIDIEASDKETATKKATRSRPTTLKLRMC